VVVVVSGIAEVAVFGVADDFDGVAGVVVVHARGGGVDVVS